MGNNHFDLIVIGAGSGGVRAARLAGAAGKKVAIIESRFFGGTCVNVGCVPKKLLVQASSKKQDMLDADGYGWKLNHSSISINWLILRDKILTEVSRLNKIYKTLLENNNVEIIEGHASFSSNTSIMVNGVELSADKILVATGSKAFLPDGIDPSLVSISDDLFTLEQLPETCLIVGAGYIAVEFAGILNNLGCKVSISCRGNTPLQYLDSSLKDYLADALVESGIQIINNSQVRNVKKIDGKIAVSFTNHEQHLYDKVFYAIGRSPNINNLGLENTDVELTGKQGVKVDENFCSSVKSIYAIGDVIDQAQLTPIALRHAMLFVKEQFDENLTVEKNTVIPTAIFSQPELATVGLTEEQAANDFDRVDIYEANFNPLSNNISGNPYRALVKLVVNNADQRVLGAHMGGVHAAEVIQALAVAIECGATKTDVDRTLGVHPSVSEEFVTLRNVSRRYLNGKIFET